MGKDTRRLKRRSAVYRRLVEPLTARDIIWVVIGATLAHFSTLL